jgi:CspA family cold shock protein
MTGRVKFYSITKRFGFITPDAEGEPDVFFHLAAVEKRAELQGGDHVEYRVVEGERGPKAAGIKLL